MTSKAQLVQGLQRQKVPLAAVDFAYRNDPKFSADMPGTTVQT